MGLRHGPHPTLEIDHLIRLCLGGSDDDKNLWPSLRSIDKEWPAELKDDLEHRLCKMVCAGSLDAPEAQREATGRSRTCTVSGAPRNKVGL